MDAAAVLEGDREWRKYDGEEGVGLGTVSETQVLYNDGKDRCRSMH